MASVFITTRTTKPDGKNKGAKRHVVRYRLGGRDYEILHGGSFKTKKEAEERCVLIAHELANGRNPADVLYVEQPTKEIVVTLSARFDEFIESRVDVGASAIRLFGNAKNRLGRLGDVPPESVKWTDVQQWIADVSDLSPKTVRHYLSSIRQVLDFCDIEPNPARNPKVKVPALAGEEVNPPSRQEFDAIVARLRGELKLPVRLMECCGLRVGELTKLTYGDVDVDGRRLRVSKARTKGKTAGQRWLSVPDELMHEIDDLVPTEDNHHERRVFPFTEPQVRDSITRACKFAKIAHYHPHDLRHRRCSLWVNVHGFDPVTVKTWSGHSNVSMLLDTYSHVMIDSADEWADFWRFAYRERRGDVVPVWSQDPDTD